MVTISEIARLAGVSKSTVSNVINHRLNRVSQKKREQILALMQELNYHPRRAAQNLKTRKTRTIGLLFPNVPLQLISNSFFFPGFLTGVAEACEEFHYQLIITTSLKNADTSFNYEFLLQSGCVDGLIVTDILDRDPRFPLLTQSGVPFVCIGKPEGGEVDHIPWVDHDYETISAYATEYLIKRGHQKILFLGPSHSRVFTRQRMRGYRKTLKKHHLPCDPSLIMCDEAYTIEATVSKIKDLLKNGNQPFSAIYTCGEYFILGILQAFRQLGLRVPEDISILSNMETDHYQYYEPLLTGTRVYPSRLGYETTRILFKCIEGQSDCPPGRFLDWSFIEGQSVSVHSPVILEKGGGQFSVR